MPAQLLMWLDKNGRKHPDQLPIPNGDGLDYLCELRKRCKKSDDPIIFAYSKQFLTSPQIEAIETLAHSEGFENLFCVDYNGFRRSCLEQVKPYEHKVCEKIRESQYIIRNGGSSAGRGAIHYLADLTRMHYLDRSDVLQQHLVDKYDRYDDKSRVLSSRRDTCLAYTDFDIELKRGVLETLEGKNFFCSVNASRTDPENSLIIVSGPNNPVIDRALTFMASPEEKDFPTDYPYGCYCEAFRVTYPSETSLVGGSNALKRSRELLGLAQVPTSAELTVGNEMAQRVLKGLDLSYIDKADRTWVSGSGLSFSYTVPCDSIVVPTTALDAAAIPPVPTTPASDSFTNTEDARRRAKQLNFLLNKNELNK